MYVSIAGDLRLRIMVLNMLAFLMLLPRGSVSGGLGGGVSGPIKGCVVGPEVDLRRGGLGGGVSGLVFELEL